MKKASVRRWVLGVVLLQCLFGSVWAGSASGVQADASEPTRPMSDGQSLKSVRVSQKPMEVGVEAELLKDIASISASMVSFGVPAAKGQKVSSASARLFRGRDGYLRSIGAPGWAYFAVTSPVEGDAERTARNFMAEHKAAFGIRSVGLGLIKLKEKRRGERAYVRFEQTYAEIPVFSAEIIVQVYGSIGVEYVLSDVMRETTRLDRGELSIMPSIPASEAEQAGIDFVGGQSAGLEFEASSAELMIYEPSVVGSSGATRLVWQTEVVSVAEPGSGEFVLVDAHTGEIALHYPLVSYDKDREIYDAQNTSSAPGTLVREEGDSPYVVVPEVDYAYDCIGDAYDFYLGYHGRDSLDDAGMTMSATVRYCRPDKPCPYENAFWYDTTERIYFGQGWVVDDIVGHELTHGVTYYTSELIYANESGAISESFSDMWGEWIDQTNGRGDDTPGVKWLIGEDRPQALRDMADPPAYGHPDRMRSPNWHPLADEPHRNNDFGGVHTNSGVGNKLCYLLTDGDTFNGHSVTGMDINDTAGLFYEVQTNLLTSGADYADLYSALTQAAVGVGWNEAERQNLEEACQAVEISDRDDLYEENDTRATAWYPGRNWEQEWLSSIDGLGIQSDDDWYEIYVSSGYERILVDCRFTHADGDIDIALHDSLGTLLDSSESTTDDEDIDYCVAGGGTYYIKVYYGNAGNTYDLWWDDVAGCGVPDLSYDSHQIDDDNTDGSSGNGDGQVNCGETIELVVTLENTGNADAHNVSAHLSTADPYVTSISDADEDYGDITAGGTGLCDWDYDFTVSPSCPDGHVIIFQLDPIQSDEGSWIDSFPITVQCDVGGDDNYEQNDTLADAYDLSEDEQTWLSEIAGPGFQLDDDWYKIYVDSGCERVLVDCRFTDADGDIDIELYDSSETKLASSWSATDNEYIDYRVPSGGTYYYIKVYFDDAGNTYDLWWDDVDPFVGKWKGRYTDNKGRSGPIRRVRVRADGTISGQLQLKFYEGGLSGTVWLPVSGDWDIIGSSAYYVSLSGSKKVQGHRTETTVTMTANLVSDNKLKGNYNSTVKVKAGGTWHSRSTGGKFVLNRCKPGKPKSVNATNGTDPNYCIITCDPVFGATEYRVFRSRKPDTKKIALSDWLPGPYFKYQPAPGKKHYYWMKARNSAGTSRFSKYDRGWRGISAFATASLDKAAQNTVNDHLYALGISRGLDYPVTEEGNLNHQFFLEAETDDTVQLIDVTTPAGANFTITDDPNTQSGPARTWHYQDQNNHYWHYQDQNNHYWQYQAQADDPNALADYTDGLYTITVTYQTGGQSTTTLAFADPNTGSAIPQPAQQPVLTAPENNATVASPVTFTWQPCNDGNVTSICLDLENQDADDDLFILLSPDDSEAGPASLTPGTWQAELSFDTFLEFDNPDGVPVSAGKYNIADYTFDVEPEDEQP